MSPQILEENFIPLEILPHLVSLSLSEMMVLPDKGCCPPIIILVKLYNHKYSRDLNMGGRGFLDYWGYGFGRGWKPNGLCIKGYLPIPSLADLRNFPPPPFILPPPPSTNFLVRPWWLGPRDPPRDKTKGATQYFLLTRPSRYPWINCPIHWIICRRETLFVDAKHLYNLYLLL